MADLVKMLREDHKKVKGLFDKFERTEDADEQMRISEETLLELQIHAKIENQLVYPLLKQEGEDEDLINEAYEEHHVAEMLISELKQMHSADGTFKAKFRVLAENVRHHIKEEESEILPRLEKGEEDLEQVAERVTALKERLRQDPSELDREMEAKMPGKQAQGRRGHGRGQSPGEGAQMAGHGASSSQRSSSRSGSRAPRSESSSKTSSRPSPAKSSTSRSSGSSGSARKKTGTRKKARAAAH